MRVKTSSPNGSKTTRVLTSIVSLIFGLVFVAVGFGIGVRNEPNAAQQAHAIAEIDDEVTADVPVDQVLTENEGQLVHVVGRAETDRIVGNEDFNISENAIAIRWDSSIYQTIELNTGRRRRSVRYEDRWVDQVVDSRQFRRNESSNNGSRKTLSVDGHSTVDDATFGAFTLPANLLQQIEDAEPFPLTSTPPALAANGTVSNGVYWTGDPANPQIGDEKMEFFIVPSPIDITVVAQQTGTTFTAYQTESDLDKQLIFVGALSKDEAVAAEQSSGRFDRWALRALSFFFSLLGFATLLRSAATGFLSLIHI